MKYYIGIDLGGTNIAAGIVNENGNIIKKDSVPTLKERPTDDIMADMVTLSQKLIDESGLKNSDISGIGIGCPGTVDNENGIITYCVNVPMENVDIGTYITSRMGIPVNLENDANAAALGEYSVNGKGVGSYILITLGTGIGGGAVIDGKIYRGFNGVGIEAGHMTLVHNGELCTCGKRGCWERYGSVSALINQTIAKMDKDKSSLMHAKAKEHGKVSGRVAFEAAKENDRSAEEVVNNYLEYVADGITSVINIFQPDILAIGGGISKEGNFLLEPVMEYVRKYEYNRHRPQTRIEIASLKNDAGIIGAAMSCIK